LRDFLSGAYNTMAEEKMTLEKLAEMVARGFETVGEEIAGLKDDVAGVKEDIVDIKDDVAALKVDLATLRTDDIDPMKKDITAIKEDVQKIRTTFAPRIEYDDRLRVIEQKLGIPTPQV